MTLDEELFVFVKINEHRNKNKLKPLKLDGFCSELARAHSQNMADQKIKFSHDQINERLNQIKVFFKDLGYVKGSENVYFASPNLGEPVASWQKSTGHNRNMLGSFNCCGVGYARAGTKHYVTAIFVQLTQKTV